MAELFASGRIADVAIAILLLEALLFVWLHARRRLGPAPGELLPNVAAGLFLLLALRGALVGAGWPWIAASLAAALAAHLADLVRRWPRGR
jgi:outer membrane biosynthesis protein TonB